MRPAACLPILATILFASCDRAEPTPAESALGPAQASDPQPVVLGVTSPETEPMPAEPGQRVAAAQVVVAGDGDLALDEADTDHDGTLDDREVAPAVPSPAAGTATDRAPADRDAHPRSAAP